MVTMVTYASNGYHSNLCYNSIDILNTTVILMYSCLTPLLHIQEHIFLMIVFLQPLNARWYQHSQELRETERQRLI